MITRYFNLKDYLDQNDLSIINFLLTPLLERALKRMFDDTNAFQSVITHLQRENTTLLEARILFDNLISAYGENYLGIGRYLSSTAKIIDNQGFENGIVKSLRGGILTEEEALVSCLNSQDLKDFAEPIEKADFAARV